MENTDIYKETYTKIKDALCEDAKGILSSDDIQEILDLEKQKFENAEKFKIKIKYITGNNLQLYTKNLIRKKQPLFGLYTVLGAASGISYLLLFWLLLQSCIYFFLGDSSAFSAPHELTYGLFASVIYTIVNEIKKYVYNTSLESPADNLTEKLSKFNRLMNTIIISFIIATFAFIYRISGLKGFIHITPLNMLYVTVAILTLAGIHNVIFNSHILHFYRVGISALKRDTKEQTNTVIEDYIRINARGIISITGSLKTNRIYCSIGMFMALVLDILCIKTLFTDITALFIVFTIDSIILTVILFTAVLSCNKILKYIEKS